MKYASAGGYGSCTSDWQIVHFVKLDSGLRVAYVGINLFVLYEPAGTAQTSRTATDGWK